MADLGYGAWSRQLGQDVIRDFLSNVDDFSHSLEKYQRYDNRMLLDCLDELILRRDRKKDEPNVLTSPALGKSKK